MHDMHVIYGKDKKVVLEIEIMIHQMLWCLWGKLHDMYIICVYSIEPMLEI
jgi:hypothetical protein